MASFGGLGIGLILVFGCLLLALVAKLCYSLCRRKMIVNRDTGEDDDCSISYAEQFFRLVCRKRPSCFQGINRTRILLRGPEANGEELDLELGSTGQQDLMIKALSDEESVEAELMRLHNLAGLPRFLSTIKEETKEDLESEDEKSRGRKGPRRSLRDLMVTADTPSLSPLASPRSESPSLIVLDAYHRIGLNPLYEHFSMEAGLNTLRSSPPPKFKFLRDAEEKLLRRLMEEAEKRRTSKNSIPVQDSHETKFPKPAQLTEEKEGYVLGIILGKNKERELLRQLPQYPPPASPQVLPLVSSPTTFRPPQDKSPVVPQIILSSS